MECRSKIEAYLLSRQGDFKDTETKSRYQKQITECVDFFEQSEYSVPDDKFFEALYTYLKGKYAETTAKKRLNLSRKFFLWCFPQKGDISMTDKHQTGHETIEEISDMAVTEKVSEVNDTPERETEQTEAKTSGRPRLGSEARTERLTVYLTPTLLKHVKILALLDDVTVPNFIFGLIKKAADDNQEDIKAQIQLQEKRKHRLA